MNTHRQGSVDVVALHLISKRGLAFAGIKGDKVPQAP